MKRPAVVTLHDLNPGTWRECLITLYRLRHEGVGPITMLITPGLAWPAHLIAAARGLSEEGVEFAAHGWDHCAPPPATRFHRLHARLISRNEAEHLSRAPGELVERMWRSYGWFVEHDFPPPRTYVPPAWALGALDRPLLQQLPFRWYESHLGIYDSETDRFRAMPLAGFLADEPGRVRPLRVFNRLNIGLARLSRLPLRISVHPSDLRFPLAPDLLELCRADWEFIDIEDAMGASRPERGAEPRRPATGKAMQTS